MQKTFVGAAIPYGHAGGGAVVAEIVGIAEGVANARRASRRGEPIRVVVVSGFRLLRDALAAALEVETGIEVIAALDLDPAREAIEALRPDVLLLDVTGGDGLALAAALGAAVPAIKIVALGVAEAEGAILACAQAGASGFVAPDASASDVAAALRSAACGEFNCSPRVAALLLSRLSALSAVAASARVDLGASDPLTPREQEIARLMSDGLPNKQIARVLGIQTATVKNHVHSILTKLGSRCRGEVAAQLRGRVDDQPSLAHAGVPARFERHQPIVVRSRI